MGLSDVLVSLSDNPYFSAGAGLFGMGAGAAFLRKSSQIAYILFRRHYMTTVEITCKDKSYQWLLRWITKKGERNTQHLSVVTSFEESTSGKISTRYDFQPSVGTHLLLCGYTWIRVERTRDQRMIDPWETIQMTALGKRRQLFSDILDEAKKMAIEEVAGRTVMYTVIGTEWREFGHPRQIRPIDSVILAEGLTERIVGDVKDFISNSNWYRQRGIPYRRGYLLYGPPGCGKTSFITALAGELQYSICVLNLSDRSISDDRLQHRLADAPENSIILLEDIDAAFVSREDGIVNKESAYAGLNRLTLSGLLNSIDGVTSSEGRILFMTTNYLERLDPALTRPGRVDISQLIDYCTQSQIAFMFKKFYPEYDKSDAGLEFARRLLAKNEKISAAMVQGYLMRFKTSPQEAISNAS